MRFLDQEQRDQIGLNFILNHFEPATPFGLEEKKRMKPFKVSETACLEKELEQVDRVVQSLRAQGTAFSKIKELLGRFKDIRNSLKGCNAGGVLDDVELYEVKYFVLLQMQLAGNYELLKLGIEDIEFCSLKEILELLDPEGKGLPTFYVYDKYSERLHTLREAKAKLERRISLEPEDARRSELIRQRLELVIEEEQEEYRIRKELSERLLGHRAKMEANIKSIGRLDFLIAKAELAVSFGGTKPKIERNSEIRMEEAFHPEIAEVLSRRGKKFTAISICLKNGTTVITGANMGGKSVTLKTITLNLLLAQMGFFVYCGQACIPVFDFIHFISDDMQSISKGLSTFGAEIIKLKEVLRYAKKGRGFIAFDEFARGTNPNEGLYLVRALGTYLDKFTSISVVSTHYDGVVQAGMAHYQVIGLKNVDFEELKEKIQRNKLHRIELIQEQMDFRLEKVSQEDEVPKDALNISILLGLDEELVGMAMENYKESRIPKSLKKEK